jgi:polyisoprenyl-teichoic acid--peptidoglycan teichoic acid transferase
MSLPPPPPPVRKIVLPNWFAGVLIIGFIIAALLTAYLAFLVVRDSIFALRNEPNGLEIVEGENESITPEDISKFINIDLPLQDEDGPAPRSWDGESRVNVLFIGVDHRGWLADQGPPLADTLILATYDPQSQSVAMLSIPRDLWIDLPGLGYHKINQSYQMGEATNYPGGGAAMAMHTIEQLLAVPIHFYVLVDFEAFVRLVDEIGGVKVNIPEEIVVDPLGDNNTKVLQPGVQTLPGDIALAYARNRDTAGSDFDRTQRQQQVIMAVRDRVINFQILPTLIAKAPILYTELSDRISTNLNVRQIFELAWDIQQIPDERVHRYIIGHDQVVETFSYDGMAILQPIPDALLQLRDEVFSTAPPPSPAEISNLSLEELVAAETASVSVRNGTIMIGLAARTDDFLRSKGIEPTEVTNADQLYEQTTIFDYSGKPKTVEYLAQVFGVVPSKLYHSYDPSSPYDIVIILGDDWAANNSMP